MFFKLLSSQIKIQQMYTGEAWSSMIGWERARRVPELAYGISGIDLDKAALLRGDSSLPFK